MAVEDGFQVSTLDILHQYRLSALDGDEEGPPAAEAIDVHVQSWDAYQAGDERWARDIFNMLLPQINLIMAINLTVCKEILVRRGIFKSAKMRIPGSAMMDAEDGRELEMIMADLAPYFRV